MSVKPLIAKTEASSLKQDVPEFDVGDSVEVHVRILEGDKERLQLFGGIVIARRGRGTNEMFTVRRIVDGEGVERVFPLHSPKVAKVEVKRRALVRRAKLYYLRDRVGKQAVRLKERVIIEKETKGRSRTRIKARKEKAAASSEGTATVEKKAKKPRARKKKETAG